MNKHYQIFEDELNHIFNYNVDEYEVVIDNFKYNFGDNCIMLKFTLDEYIYGEFKESINFKVNIDEIDRVIRLTSYILRHNKFGFLKEELKYFDNHIYDVIRNTFLPEKCNY